MPSLDHGTLSPRHPARSRPSQVSSGDAVSKSTHGVAQICSRTRIRICTFRQLPMFFSGMTTWLSLASTTCVDDRSVKCSPHPVMSKPWSRTLRMAVENADRSRSWYSLLAKSSLKS